MTAEYVLPPCGMSRAWGVGVDRSALVAISLVLRKPATGEGMDKSTLAYTQIQIIIIHFLPSPIPPIPNG
jgi:hypothetical protein